MKTIEGYDVKIFTDNVEQEAIDQIKSLVELPAFSNSKIRIMPDTHAGAGCVIGFTGDLGDKVIPNIVGVDIGCGMIVLELGKLDYPSSEYLHEFHNWINTFVPSGMNVRDRKYILSSVPTEFRQSFEQYYKMAKDLIRELICYRDLKKVEYLEASIGSLGGGNHFIELNKDAEGYYYLVVHTGSRNLGKQVADIYQKKAIEQCTEGAYEFEVKVKETIKKMKAEGRRKEIQGVIARMKNEQSMKKPSVPKDLCYLTGELRDAYLHDMRICQQWATLNRCVIIGILEKFFKIPRILKSWQTVHNYIGDDNIIRKGAISAYKDEKVIIPMNMRDGSLICIGKGNEDWNFSAPHGAGRIMSRSKAFENISMDEFTDSMKGINTWSVNANTIDEAPMVYKPMQEIIDNIKDTVEIVNIIKPVFNFKASN